MEEKSKGFAGIPPIGGGVREDPSGLEFLFSSARKKNRQNNKITKLINKTIRMAQGNIMLSYLRKWFSKKKWYTLFILN